MEDKKTKILYIITGMKTGGAEILVRDINRNINTELLEVTILSLTSLGEVGREVFEDRENIKFLDIKSKLNPFIFLKLFLFIKKNNPDIIHTHLFHAHILGRIIGRMFDTQITVSTFHSDNLGGFLREKFLKYTDLFTEINIAVSKAVAERLIKKNISTENKLRIIHNGIDLDNFLFRDYEKREKIRQKLSINQKDRLFISVGRLNKVKGHSYLIESFKKVNDQLSEDDKLIIIGDGKEKDNLLHKIKELKLSDSVFLLGRKNNVSDYLNAADLFISPSIHEGFGISIAEAMASGVPVIATDVGGVSELIEDEKTGFLLKSGSAEDLTRKIKHLLDLPTDDLKKITDAARDDIEKKFSIGIMVKKYEYLYKTLLE